MKDRKNIKGNVFFCIYILVESNIAEKKLDNERFTALLLSVFL